MWDQQMLFLAIVQTSNIIESKLFNTVLFKFPWRQMQSEKDVAWIRCVERENMMMAKLH